MTRVAVTGAGAAGLESVRTLTAVGHDVESLHLLAFSEHFSLAERSRPTHSGVVLRRVS